ncbi:MAG: hypothetical protein QXQ94_11355 [Candidatus Bathyarchaeia archaeon]
MKIERLRVGKGRTSQHNNEEWIKEYYELEVAIEDPSEIEIAKANLRGLIDGWLSKTNQQPTPTTNQEINKTEKEAPSWNSEKIIWEKAHGDKGPYERSSDINNPEFRAMLKDLAAHNGKLTKDDYFYWTFKNRTTVGRKKRHKNSGDKGS